MRPKQLQLLKILSTSSCINLMTIRCFHRSHNTPCYTPISLGIYKDVQSSPEKLKTMLMQKFWGGKQGVLWDREESLFLQRVLTAFQAMIIVFSRCTLREMTSDLLS